MSKTITGVASCLLLLVSIAHGADFDVSKYGAKGDGKTDDSKAINAAWTAACAATSASKVIVGKATFLSGPMVFKGPCKAPITIEVQGTIQAPKDPSKFKSQDGWIVFQNINGLILRSGTFDGQGELAWSKKDCAKTGKCSLPINLRFTGVTNSKIIGISSVNSKYFHINVINCKNTTFENMAINAPSHSLKTDGIHIGKSTGINIINANIKTGDDCVSLGHGCQDINVQGVMCGPGHGISIGSLGKNQNEEPVSGITVTNCTFMNTLNGVRIKTVPGSPAGVASNMHFQNIIVNNVSTPILIDQEYCPNEKCKKEVPSKVKISNVSFKGISGTSATQLAVKLVCSKAVPCTNVAVEDINLIYSGKEGAATSHCANVKPKVAGQMLPPISSQALSN